MITHDNVVNFLKKSLTTYFKTVNNGKYSDFADRMDIFEEGSYNSNKDIIITVQFLKGTTQLGFTDMPMNVIFEVIEGKATKGKTIANKVMDLINSFIEDFNNTTTAMVDEENLKYDGYVAQTDDYEFSEESTPDEPYVVTQYYSSTASIGNGQQRGTNKYKAFSMDMRLIIYKNGYYKSLEDSSVKFTYESVSEKKLENVLEITSHITHSFEPRTEGNNPKQKLTLTGIQYQISVTYIATKDDALHIHIANNARSDFEYTIKHNGYITRTAHMKLVDYTESTPYADVLKVSAVFAEV